MRAERYKEKKRRQRRVLAWCMSLVLLAALVLGVVVLCRQHAVHPLIRAYAKEQNIPLGAWPRELSELLERNEETREFVLHYPEKKALKQSVDLSDEAHSETVPLLMQWDERWGYGRYAGNLMGLSGCGPTCLSMVCLYLLDDQNLTPPAIAQFAEEQGYAAAGSGSAWTLISEGGAALGLEVEELPLHDGTIIGELEAGNPVVIVVGEGDFTTSGHFLVMTAYQDGFVTVNDPNSRANSEKEWELTAVMPQIRNLWACRTPQ